MFRTSARSDTRSGGEQIDIPDEAAHLVAVKSVWGPIPDGHAVEGWRTSRRTEERREMLYQPGDELPFEASLEVVRHHPQQIAVVDDDGEFLTGAFGVSVVDRGHALTEWRRGSCFRPGKRGEE